MDPALAEVLERSRAVGFLGPGPVRDHVEHAARMGRALPFGLAGGSGGCHFADIGAGGGVPGLPILVDRPASSAVLIDASQKRCAFLTWAVVELALADRVEVWWGRAEEIGREDRARERFDAVVARSFGPPAITVECAAPLLVDGGRIVVSEPPSPRRWPPEGLALAGLIQLPSEEGLAVFERTGPLPDSLPRTTKQMQRAPLFELG